MANIARTVHKTLSGRFGYPQQGTHKNKNYSEKEQLFHLEEKLYDEDLWSPSIVTSEPVLLLPVFCILALIAANPLLAVDSIKRLTLGNGALAWLPISRAVYHTDNAIAFSIGINLIAFAPASLLVRRTNLKFIVSVGYVIIATGWVVLGLQHKYPYLVLGLSCLGIGNAFVYMALQSIGNLFAPDRMEIEILALLSIADASGLIIPKVLALTSHAFPESTSYVLLSWGSLLLCVSVLSIFLVPRRMPGPRCRPIFSTIAHDPLYDFYERQLRTRQTSLAVSLSLLDRHSRQRIVAHTLENYHKRSQRQVFRRAGIEQLWRARRTTRSLDRSLVPSMSQNSSISTTSRKRRKTDRFPVAFDVLMEEAMRKRSVPTESDVTTPSSNLVDTNRRIKDPDAHHRRSNQVLPQNLENTDHHNHAIDSGVRGAANGPLRSGAAGEAITYRSRASHYAAPRIGATSVLRMRSTVWLRRRRYRRINDGTTTSRSFYPNAAPDSAADSEPSPSQPSGVDNWKSRPSRKRIGMQRNNGTEVSRLDGDTSCSTSELGWIETCETSMHKFLSWMFLHSHERHLKERVLYPAFVEPSSPAAQLSQDEYSTDEGTETPSPGFSTRDQMCQPATFGYRARYASRKKKKSCGETLPVISQDPPDSLIDSVAIHPHLLKEELHRCNLISEGGPDDDNILKRDAPTVESSPLGLSQVVIVIFTLCWMQFADLERLLLLRKCILSISHSPRVAEYYQHTFELLFPVVPQAILFVILVGFLNHVYLEWRRLIAILTIMNLLIFSAFCCGLTQLLWAQILSFVCTFIHHPFIHGFPLVTFLYLHGKERANLLAHIALGCRGATCCVWIIWHAYCTVAGDFPVFRRTTVFTVIGGLMFIPIIGLYFLEPRVSGDIAGFAAEVDKKRHSRLTDDDMASAFKERSWIQDTLNGYYAAYSTRPCVRLATILLPTFPPHILAELRCFSTTHSITSGYRDCFGRAWLPNSNSR